MFTSMDRFEAIPMLRRPTEGQDIVADYQNLGLTLERHPMALLRSQFESRRYVTAGMLPSLRNGDVLRVAGLVITKQRPGTASGVTFVTLEDETGVSNVIVWRKIYERFRRAVIAGRCLRVTGRMQREGGVSHILAEEIEDISWMLDDLLRENHELCRAGDQP